MAKTDKKLVEYRHAAGEAVNVLGGFELPEDIRKKIPVKLIERFNAGVNARVCDMRDQWLIEYPLSSMILLTFIAVLCGADNWIEIENFCRTKSEWLKKFIPLPNGRTPCNDTFRRVFHMIDQEEFKRMSVEFIVTSLDDMKRGLGMKLPAGQRKVYCIDGKQEKGTGRLAGTDREIRDQQTLHIYEPERGICVISKRIDIKKNEIPVAQYLLSQNKDMIKGSIFTADSLHTQYPTVQLIRQNGGDYVFGLKGNQSSLKNDVERVFTEEKKAELRKYSNRFFAAVEIAHNQIEIREYYMFTDVDELPANQPKEKWLGLAAVMAVDKKCISLVTDEISSETRYYISSLNEIELFASCIRLHWGVEEQHFFQDTVFHQDDNQTVDENSFQNLAEIKRMCLTLLKIYAVLEGTSVSQTRKNIGWNPETHLPRLLGFYDAETLEKALTAGQTAPKEKPKKKNIKYQTYLAQQAQAENEGVQQ